MANSHYETQKKRRVARLPVKRSHNGPRFKCSKCSRCGLESGEWPQERKSHGVLGAPKPCVELAAADSDAAPPPREEHSLAEQCRKAPGARN